MFVSGGLYLSAVAALIIDGFTDSASQSDVAVVLGNQVTNEGVPSERLAARLDKAIELYEASVASKILVSGGVGASGYDEAEVMAEYLAERGVPSSDILVDSLGVNTRATAENTANLMEKNGWTSAIVVTQYFHVTRSRLAFHQEGIEQVSTAHANHVELRDVYALTREIPAYVKYRMHR